MEPEPDTTNKQESCRNVASYREVKPACWVWASHRILEEIQGKHSWAAKMLFVDLENWTNVQTDRVKILLG